MTVYISSKILRILWHTGNVILIRKLCSYFHFQHQIWKNKNAKIVCYLRLTEYAMLVTSLYVKYQSAIAGDTNVKLNCAINVFKIGLYYKIHVVKKDDVDRFSPAKDNNIWNVFISFFLCLIRFQSEFIRIKVNFVSAYNSIFGADQKLRTEAEFWSSRCSLNLYIFLLINSVTKIFCYAQRGIWRKLCPVSSNLLLI